MSRTTWHHIPTSIITGFLGSGKSTAINHLLSLAPPGERWGVLVNEFGRVGVDGALLGGAPAAIEIREVPGGCLCCTAGQAFEAALNRMIREHSPERIIIEPTGIAHPAQVIRSLSGGFYREVLDLKAVICLVDARKLADDRYRNHPSFRDQIALADVLVSSKSDLDTAVDREAFLRLAEASVPAKSAVGACSEGRLEPAWLDLGREARRLAEFPDAHLHGNRHRHPLEGAREPIRRDAWMVLEGTRDGFYSCGWLIGEGISFSREALASLFSRTPLARVKAVVRCGDGWLAWNAEAGVATSSRATPPKDGASRIELLDFGAIGREAFERKLRQAILSP